MKKFCIFLLLLAIDFPVFSQIADDSKLSAILKKASVDSVEKTERLAAIFFHEIINRYRIAQKKPALAWDDTLWLAARNHCNWMIANEELSHEEKPGTKLFTGAWPGDRYEYASKEKGSCSWSGENALYNCSATGKNCAANALAMAEESFDQWKHSPGHNENMLNGASCVHGVAFRIAKGGVVWATDLFCYKPSYSPIVASPKLLLSAKGIAYSPTENPEDTINPSAVVVATPKPVAKGKNPKYVSASSKYVKLDINKTTDDLESSLYASAGFHQSKSMGKAAQHHAEYMAANQKITHDEKKQKRKYYAGSPQRRIVKASRGAKVFHARSTHYVESITLISADAATLNIAELTKLILEGLDKEREELSGNTTAVGFGIVIKRVKNELRVYVVREEGVKKQ